MLRIFLVESQEISKRGLLQVLSAEEDFTIVSSESAASAALPQILALTPDLIIIDLPEQKDIGMDAVREIISLNPEIRVVAFTALGDDDALQKTLSVGVHAYVLKGTSIELLLSAIRAVGAGASWLDPAIARRALKACCTVRSTKTSHKGILKPLSARETEVLSLMSDGLGNQQIATQLIVSPETVKTHVRHIMEKLQVSSRTEAAVKALKIGIVGNSQELLYGS